MYVCTYACVCRHTCIQKVYKMFEQTSRGSSSYKKRERERNVLINIFLKNEWFFSSIERFCGANPLQAWTGP